MPYVEWWGNVLGNIKTVDLMELLGIPRYAAVGIRATIYAFAIEYHPGGYFPEALVPKCCGWREDPKKLIDMLKNLNLIEETETPGIIKIHDWEEYTKNYRKSLVDAKRSVARYRRLAGLEQKEELPKKEAPQTEDAPLGQLLQLARQAKCPNNDETLRKHLAALVHRPDVGIEKVKLYLCSLEAQGKTVNDWQNHFKVNPNGAVPFVKGKTKPPNPDCKYCGGRGRRLNPATQRDIDCACVSAHTGRG